jgi:hypothetical protein
MLGECWAAREAADGELRVAFEQELFQRLEAGDEDAAALRERCE